MRMINPRAGHGAAFGMGIFYLLGGIIIGWPIAVPVIYVLGFLSEKFNFRMNTLPVDVIVGISIIAGTYIHYKLWVLLIGALGAWWNK